MSGVTCHYFFSFQGQHCQTGEAFQELLKDQVGDAGGWVCAKCSVLAAAKQAKVPPGQPASSVGTSETATSTRTSQRQRLQGAHALACPCRGTFASCDIHHFRASFKSIVGNLCVAVAGCPLDRRYRPAGSAMK